MIRVAKPTTPPAVLVARGVAAAQTHCSEHDSAPAEYRNGTRTFDFDRSIYAAAEVRDALRDAQHSKCAFCESLFAHTGYGDVEHFRPKAGYKQRESDALRRPGYYWLAYEWSNLFYSCQLCNQRFKGNLFPLADGRGRARSHAENLSKEVPLLVNPVEQDPATFLGFRGEYAVAVSGSREGATTIEVLGLNREELVENRRKRLEDLNNLQELCETLRNLIATNPTPELATRLTLHETRLHQRQLPPAEYAGMARAYLR